MTGTKGTIVYACALVVLSACELAVASPRVSAAAARGTIIFSERTWNHYHFLTVNSTRRGKSMEEDASNVGNNNLRKVTRRRADRGLGCDPTGCAVAKDFSRFEGLTSGFLGQITGACRKSRHKSDPAILAWRNVLEAKDLWMF